MHPLGMQGCSCCGLWHMCSAGLSCRCVQDAVDVWARTFAALGINYNGSTMTLDLCEHAMGCLLCSMMVWAWDACTSSCRGVFRGLFHRPAENVCPKLTLLRIKQEEMAVYGVGKEDWPNWKTRACLCSATTPLHLRDLHVVHMCVGHLLGIQVSSMAQCMDIWASCKRHNMCAA